MLLVLAELMRSQLMMMMMMRVILSMNDIRVDRCSHFRCRKTCTHACIHIYDKRTCQFGRSSTVKFLVGRNSFNSFSLLSIFISISISASLHIFSLSLYLSLTSLLTSNLSLSASALACMFFFPSVPWRRPALVLPLACLFALSTSALVNGYK